MKWEPVAAMVALLVLGLWVVWGPAAGTRGITTLPPGAITAEARLGNQRGVVAMMPGEGGEEAKYQVLLRGGFHSAPMNAAEFRVLFGEKLIDQLSHGENPLFRLLNIHSWMSLVWVAVGFVGQMAFFGRMMIQWLVSEKQRKSVIPPLFWWLSLFGGVALFAYFAWRQDAVGVLGQTSGVVIYARNIRLIRKERRREERAALRAAAPSVVADPAPEPVDDPELARVS
jgi:lipid-A-disaccharide synthase-like uncharacterized protein